LVITLIVLCALPIVLWLGFWALLIGGEAANQFVNSGSATGDAAVVEVSKSVGNDLLAPVRGKITNARAEWTAPDFHGDRSAYLSFDVPTPQIPILEAHMIAQLSARRNGAPPDRPARMPTSNDTPGWFKQALPNPVFYECGFVSIGMSRQTGLVLIRYWAW
jgi:hypothetical protein